MRTKNGAWTHPATWIATLALAVSLGGSAYAATQLTGNDIKNGSLTGKDLKDGSITIKDVDAKVEGARGPAGATGPSGPAGPGTTFVTSTDASTSAPGVMEYESQAHCDDGQQVVGAGYVATPNQSGLRAVRNYAIDADSWLVRIESPSPVQIQLTIVAICAS